MSETNRVNDIKISLPREVNFIIDTIRSAGYEAFAVGGCVRDRLLFKEPDDYDITSSATPDVIKGLFKRTIDTGIQHGTVTVMLSNRGYEVTTYRIDGKYEDNRHPTAVSFTSSLEEDLLRRDFTINAMAYNEYEGLVDPFDGQKDLKDGIIRCVGNPLERFSEDALRIMRAIRFSAQLGYDIEEATLEAMRSLCNNLQSVSMERIQTELVKLMLSANPGRLLLAYELGITKVILPEFDIMMKTEQNHPHHMYNVGIHTIKAIENIRADKVLRLTMLFHDMGKPYVHTIDENGIDHFHNHQIESERIARKELKRLKFDNDTLNMVCHLTKIHDLRIEAKNKSVRKAINSVGKEEFLLLLEVENADILAQSFYKREEKLMHLQKLRTLYDEIIKKGDCVSLKDLKINGKMLIELGYKSGPSVGRELNALLERVIDDPSLNDRDVLIKIAKGDINEE